VQGKPRGIFDIHSIYKPAEKQHNFNARDWEIAVRNKPVI
jgi:hypothetical protein